MSVGQQLEVRAGHARQSSHVTSVIVSLPDPEDETESVAGQPPLR